MKFNVLVADDESLIREMLTDELTDHPDIEVFEADGGLSAMKKLKENKIDLMITDLIMPNQSGIETILEVKKLYPRIKIFAISGSEENLRKAKTFGADQVFEKPFNAIYIAEQVKKILDV